MVRNRRSCVNRENDFASAAVSVGRAGGVLAALGIGAAIFYGTGVAAADDASTGSAAPTSGGSDAHTSATSKPSVARSKSDRPGRPAGGTGRPTVQANNPTSSTKPLATMNFTSFPLSRPSPRLEEAAAVPIAFAPVQTTAVEVPVIAKTIPASARQLPTATIQAVLKAVEADPANPLAPIVSRLSGLIWGTARKGDSLEAAPTSSASALSAAVTPTDPSVTYSVTNDWGSGHNAAMTVTAGTTALTSWTVEFDSPAQITNIWNAQITSHIGTHYVVSSMSYNAKVAAGQSAAFGYQASPGAVASTPTNVKVNGVASGSPQAAPTVSIADLSVVEGNSGTSNANFVVTLSKAATTVVTVGYSTANGTATAGADFTAVSGTLTFAPGVTSQTIAVKIIGDATVESNETFSVALTNPSGATIAKGTATATITNDDVATPPTVSIADVSVAEGNSGNGNANFTVTLSKAATTAVTVGYSTANGTASAGTDYTAKSGTVTFAPGVTSQIVAVKVIGDTTVESNETFTVTLTNSSGATIARASATGTITNDDVVTPPTVSIADVSVVEGNSGASNANFTVTLSKAATTAITVGYSTASGTATAGTDFTAASGMLTFAPGVTSQTIAVKVFGDTTVESNETFAVTLTNPSGAAIARASATGTITNDDNATTPQQGLNSATYAVLSDWGSGHNVSMTVNAGQKLTGWTVEFDSAAQITNIWNAQITSHVGTHYVISNAAYNGDIVAGGSTSFGYQATLSAAASAPINLTVTVPGATPAGPGTWGTPTRAVYFTDSSVLSKDWVVYDEMTKEGNRTPDAISFSDGVMTITGDAQGNDGGMAWVPGQMYGGWEVRLRVPVGAANYDAVLLLWPDAENWPTGGEVDFLEMWDDPTRQRVNTTFHYGAANNQIVTTAIVDATQWHDYAVKWTPTEIVTYVDGVVLFRTTDTSTFPPGLMHLCIQLDTMGPDISAGAQMQVAWAKQYGLDNVT